MQILGINLLELTPLFINNNTIIKLLRNLEFYARTKHITLRHYFIYKHVLNNDVRLEQVDTKDNIANLLIKGLL